MLVQAVYPGNTEALVVGMHALWWWCEQEGMRCIWESELEIQTIEIGEKQVIVSTCEDSSKVMLDAQVTALEEQTHVEKGLCLDGLIQLSQGHGRLGWNQDGLVVQFMD